MEALAPDPLSQLAIARPATGGDRVPVNAFGGSSPDVVPAGTHPFVIGR